MDQQKKSLSKQSFKMKRKNKTTDFDKKPQMLAKFIQDPYKAKE